MSATPSRREIVAVGLAAACGLGPRRAAAGEAPVVATLREAAGADISLLVFGSNEIGVMDGGAPSAQFDRAAGVTARRLGGDLTTTYNWVNNACNAGKNHNQANGDFLLEALQIPRDERGRPAVVIEAMHEASLGMGARSLVTLPLSPWVAADMNGPVAVAETAPSPRFAPTRWTPGAGAGDPVNPAVCDLPQLVARLVKTYGEAGSRRGVFAYALDNEPGLWTQNHPRVAPARMPVEEFVARSIAAARAIKSVDPGALVFGPSSWGATGMVNFQNAPDWSSYARYGSFLALYLDAFRKASEADGRRLLDALDVHWYPFSSAGSLFRTDTEALDRARLDAPRSLSEEGFVEQSWVASALRHAGDGGLGLPVLPSLRRIISRNFPGTKLAVTEFNYGLGKRVPSALALADALGRYATGGVFLATHWGSLADMLGEAYRLYRAPDARGAGFGGRALAVQHGASDSISVFAAADGAACRVVAINRSAREIAIDLAGLAPAQGPKAATLGFDSRRRSLGECAEAPARIDGVWRIVLPPLSARRYLFA